RQKQPTGRGPTGCDENRQAAALLVGYVSLQICALLAPCRPPILIATVLLIYVKQCTRSEWTWDPRWSESHVKSIAAPSPFPICNVGVRTEAPDPDIC